MATKICILSDTHSYCGPDLKPYVENNDEVWHAGDLGSTEVLDFLQTYNARIVHGNIDGSEIRKECEENLVFTLEGLTVFMTHIAAVPPKYNPHIRRQIDRFSPDLLVCGHSHILRVIRDAERNLLYINPGACGHFGFHLHRTMIQCVLDEGHVKEMQVIELGKRGRHKKAINYGE